VCQIFKEIDITKTKMIDFCILKKGNLEKMDDGIIKKKKK
jgi:hypothetical protein